MTAREHRLYHRLQLAAHLARKEADRRVTAACGLPVAKVAVLTVVSTAPAPPSQRDVARELGINESAVTDTVRRLVASGHLRSTRAPGDARVKVLELTELGGVTLRRAEAPFAEVNAVIDAALDPGEVATLTAALDRLTAGFGAAPDGSAPTG
ncbi:MAG: MarR family winged helix-turn-helix transcriptional regulator [Actinomycetota bacterium]|nr:MarR family winged helix-turn-helix transcriptional regulator [Actinomycetota bacterium]